MATRKPKVQVVDISLGEKMPPQNIDAERAVLGIIVSEPRAIDSVAEIIKAPEAFYLDAHQKIFSAMLALRDSSCFISIVTLVERLMKDGCLDDVGGMYGITKLTDGVVSSAGLEAHCRIVLEKHMLRELAKVGGNIVHHAYSGTQDVFDLIDYAEASVLAVNSTVTSNYEKLDAGMMESIKRIEALMNSDKQLTGVPTGFRDLDHLTCGWQQPDLIILAARPSVGKTAFALNLGLNACTNKETPTGVGFFSLEMSKEQLKQRLLSVQSQIYLAKISRGKLTQDELADLQRLGAEPLSKLNFYIDDTAGLNIYELRAKARRMVRHGVGLIIIDYLQLMSGIQNGRADNREQEISKISRDLKGLAKELQVPIIALSQLSRDVEKRKDGNKMPVLSDLRESGAIEQDADIVMFMYRPEYYGNKVNENGDKYDGETHIKFAKHRSGALDTIKLTANLSIQKFQNFEEKPKQLGIGSAMMQTPVKIINDQGEAEEFQF